MKRFGSFFLLLVCFAAPSFAEDWPTLRRDNGRSAVTSDELVAPLTQGWQRLSATIPQTAWPGPAKWDAFSGNEGLQSQRNFDPAFFTTIVGGRLYFASSVDDAVHCLDARSGEEQWVFFTDGPVRLPPTIVEGKALFGSDDGFVYCVDARSGKEVWHVRGGFDERLIPSNGKLISPWPCRTGVLVEDGVAYCAFSLLPWKSSFLLALDVESGAIVYRQTVEGAMLQGPMLVMGDRLVVTQGKAPPIAFDRATGERDGALEKAGGVWAAMAGEGRVLVSPAGQKASDDVTQIVDATTMKFIADLPGADRALFDDGVCYLRQSGRLSALDFDAYATARGRHRQLSAEKSSLAKKKPEGYQERVKEIEVELPALAAKAKGALMWQGRPGAVHDLAKAGATLLVGLDGAAVGVEAETGRERWRVSVDGKACGLTARDGWLYVSTDLGHIFAFGPKE